VPAEALLALLAAWRAGGQQAAAAEASAASLGIGLSKTVPLLIHESGQGSDLRQRIALMPLREDEAMPAQLLRDRAALAEVLRGGARAAYVK
jgi:hypothetical protein